MTLNEFRIVFRLQYPAVVLYAAKILHDDDVEDVVQDVFVELWRRREQITEEKHIHAFLFRAVYTRALNVLKHRSVIHKYSKEYLCIEKKRLEYYNPAHNTTAKYVENMELGRQIEEAIEELPDKRRQIFIMGYVHGISNKEIAEMMNISVRTVEVQIYKALKYLRVRLGYLTSFLLFFCFK